MNRRVILGLVGGLLAGFGDPSPAPAQATRAPDPSAQPSVGMAPISSIGDSINNTTEYRSTVPFASSTVPTSPVGVGPNAMIPRPPIESSPVGMTPIEPIQQSINRGFRLGGFSSMFRKPASSPAPALLRTPARVEPSPKVDAAAHGASMYAPRTAARPAPFASRVPEAPRAQADSPVLPPTDAPSTGRPAPFVEERPRGARAQAPVVNAPSYQPAEMPPVAKAPIVVPEPVEATPTPLPAEPSTLPLPLPSAPAAELPPPPALEPTTTPPVGLDPLGTTPPIPASNAPAFASPPVEVASIPVVAPSRPDPASPPIDPELSRTSRDEIAFKTGPTRHKLTANASIRAAAVGDEIITMNELTTAVNDHLKKVMAGQAGQIPADQLKQIKNQVAASVLNGMIDQALVVQQAKAKLKANPKVKEVVDEMIEKAWKADELPPLLRQTASSNPYELKIKLAAEGKSYDAMKAQFRKMMLFHQFLGNEIHNKVTSDMIELKAYYNDHLYMFEQPSRMTWREVEINVAKYPNRTAARQKADEALARLLRDEDFAAVARSTSNGPTASKGGLYVDMQPGSYGIPVVNDELNRIPVGQVSQVLEAPGSFHIVRVDSRREKGPLRFDEVQERVRGLVIEQNRQKAIEDYLAKLRAKTLIRTMFDNTDSDPELARRDAAIRQASGSR